MTISQELREAAQTLGEALYTSPAVQALKEVESAIAADGAFMRDLAEMNRMYEDILARQEAGEVVAQSELQWFTGLRDRVYAHPLMLEREQRLQAVKALFEWTGATLNSILSVDFIALSEGE